jgi:tetratricopeptide (TPR) repeat protein
VRVADSPRIQDLRRRIQEDPASLAFAPLAEELRRAGRVEEAVAVCRDGLDFHPEYLSARATLGRALLDLGRLEEAFVELTAVLRAAPEHLSALRGVADVHYRRGELAEALETSRTALALVRHDVDLERLIAELERRVPISPPAPAAASNAPVPDRTPSGDRQRAILGGLEQFLMAVLTDRARRASLGRS